MTAPAPGALRPDPGLPQRDLLLAGVEIARRLSARPGSGSAADIQLCKPIRARYQVGRSLRVLYQVATTRSSHLVALRTFPGERSAEVYRKAAPGALESGELAGVAHEPDLGAVLFTFPNDRKIAGLRVLADLCGETGVTSRLVAYAPEKCATARLEDSAGRTLGYAKAYAGDDGERTARIYDSLGESASEVGLRLPRVRSYLAVDRMLVCEPVLGRRLSQLSGAGADAGFHGLGSAIAALHRLPPPADAQPFDRFDLDRLEASAKLIGRMRPDLEALAGEVVATLVEHPLAAAAPVCLHGDVHPKNAIVTDGDVALVDLDQVAGGPPAADVASLLAKLRYARVVGDISLAVERARAGAFLDGYHSARELPDAHALDWHVSASLLAERGLRAITRVRPAGLLRLAELLGEARQVARRLEDSPR